MNAIPKLSKSTKGIILITALVIVGLLSSSYWYGWSGIKPALASIGGLIVIIGLWMEKEADEEAKKEEHLNEAIRFKAKWGWRVLMIGIVVEVMMGAALAVMDMNESVKNDPWNGNISDISADLYLETNLTNNETEAHWHPPTVAAMLFLISGKPTFTNGSTVLPPLVTTLPSLTSFSFVHMGTLPDASVSVEHISYSMNLRSMGNVPLLRSPVRELSGVGILYIQPSFLPTNCVIEYGAVRVSVNGRLAKLFVMPMQSPIGSMRMLIATNFENSWN